MISVLPSQNDRRSALHGRIILSLLCANLMFVATDSAANPSQPVEVRLELVIQDDAGDLTPARVRVLGSDGRVHPDTLDTMRMTHLVFGKYFYADGSAWVTVPPGMTRVTVGKGFENRAYDRWVDVQADTSVVVRLQRAFDLGQDGWYGGDVHAHANHGEAHYDITPVLGRRVARAEGLSVTHFLDESDHFTGAPHPISDDEAVLYYSYEYRNQAGGHVALPGLRQAVDTGCCRPPYSVIPMITDLRREVVPDKGPLIVLSHPHPTDDFFYDEGWPGWGLGREGPVLAGLGVLDAYDVASYNNLGMLDWDTWYDIIGSGRACIPSAGTDTPLNYVYSPPPGGLRVYAQQADHGPLDYDLWLEGYAAGRTFVTNYPLIPDFEVNGVRPPGTIGVDSASVALTVRIHAMCAVYLQRLALVADGQEVWSAASLGFPPPIEVDTTFTVELPAPSFVCARVIGQTGHIHALLGTPFAQTNAVRFTRNGEPIRRTDSCARLMDRVSLYETFAWQRGGWNESWEDDTVRARVDRARAFYRSAFRLPPGPFVLISPMNADTVEQNSLSLEWTEAIDPEPGDIVDYVVRIFPDSTLQGGFIYRVRETQIENLPLAPDRWYWWNVLATDRGGNTTQSTPFVQTFFLSRPVTVDAGDPRVVMNAHPRVFPNPARGPIRIEGIEPPVSIIDVAGRVIASASEEADGALTWSGRLASGAAAPPGLYWARGRGGAHAIRLTMAR